MNFFDKNLIKNEKHIVQDKSHLSQVTIQYNKSTPVYNEFKKTKNIHWYKTQETVRIMYRNRGKRSGDILQPTCFTVLI